MVVRRVLTVLALATLALSTAAGPATAAGPGGAEPPPGGAENGTRLMEGTSLYPRAIQLAHNGEANGTIVVSTVTFTADGGQGAIFSSTDEGGSFDRIGTVSDPGATDGLCCSTLYELPRQVGDLPEGTLLWSASVGQDQDEATRRMTLPIWASTDQGRTWEHVSTAATAPGGEGLWEPEFTVSPDGELVLYVSDENQQPTHSQTIVQSTSADGVTWSPLENVIALDDPALRPGMPVVRQLPDSSYLMSYEICGPVQDCQHYTRRSADATTWQDPADLGNPVRTADGSHFRHTPNLSWYNDGTPDGRLLGVGQMLYGADGSILPGSGSSIMTNEGVPEEAWTTAPAPVSILAPWNNYCPNYSPTLLALPESDKLLELSTGYETEGGVCTTYFAVAGLPD